MSLIIQSILVNDAISLFAFHVMMKCHSVNVKKIQYVKVQIKSEFRPAQIEVQDQLMETALHCNI